MPYGASIEVTPLRLGNAFIRVIYEKMRLNFVPQPAITLIENMWNHILQGIWGIYQPHSR